MKQKMIAEACVVIAGSGIVGTTAVILPRGCRNAGCFMRSGISSRRTKPGVFTLLRISLPSLVC